MSIKHVFLIIFALLFFYGKSIGAEQNFVPDDGYVPNAKTASMIAVAVWIPIYGKENIEKQAPYKAVLKDGIWYVKGTFSREPKKMVNKNGEILHVRTAGGVAQAEISRKTGQILRVAHGE